MATVRPKRRKDPREARRELLLETKRAEQAMRDAVRAYDVASKLQAKGAGAPKLLAGLAFHRNQLDQFRKRLGAARRELERQRED